MHELASYPEALLDLLTARLGGTRTTIALYDVVIVRLRDGLDPDLVRIVPDLERQADEAREHEQWLEEQVHALGGNVHGESEMSALESRETGAIHDIVDRDPDAFHLFHALLAAVLVDTAGWAVLVEVADEAGDRAARLALRQRLDEREGHVAYLRRMMELLACRYVLRERAPIIAA